MDAAAPDGAPPRRIKYGFYYNVLPRRAPEGP